MTQSSVFRLRLPVGFSLLVIPLLGALTVAPARAGDEDCVVCVPELISEVSTCCAPIGEVPPTPGAVPDLPDPLPSACFTNTEVADCRFFDIEAEPFDCTPLPCDDGEEQVSITVLKLVGKAIEEVCDECPPSEAGQCGDAVDNDQWTELSGEADCMDTDCLDDPACPGQMAPTASGRGIMIVVTAMLALGVVALRRRSGDAQ